jgi:hypothetical protein
VNIVKKFIAVLIVFLLVFNTSMLNVTYHAVSAAVNNARRRISERLIKQGSLKSSIFLCKRLIQ